MKLLATRRPSPAMVVALIALFVAFGGGAYAAGVINGKRLKNHSVTPKKIKRNSLTGRQIKESKLGTVPSAANAATLGGQPASAGAHFWIPPCR